jgi:hypothetical protein
MTAGKLRTMVSNVYVYNLSFDASFKGRGYKFIFERLPHRYDRF